MSTPLDETQEKLHQTALDVARRYTDFESYGSPTKACRALQKRMPGFGLKQYIEAFQQALHLLEVADEIVAAHKDFLFAHYRTPERIGALAIEKEIQSHCPSFSIASCRSAWGWVFYWRYLR